MNPETRISYAPSRPRRLRDDLERHPKLVRGVAIAATAIAASQIVPRIADHFDGPDFSEETKKITVQSGDTLWGIVEDPEMGIHGIDKIDTRDAIDHIKSDPANTDVFENGQLDIGETIVIPESIVTPEASDD